MRLLRRTYSLPAETVERFERAVPRGQRGAVISRLIEEWLCDHLSEEDREQLRADVIEGCREMWDVYLEIEKEYHPLEEEAQRIFDKS